MKPVRPVHLGAGRSERAMRPPSPLPEAPAPPTQAWRDTVSAPVVLKANGIVDALRDSALIWVPVRTILRSIKATNEQFLAAVEPLVQARLVLRAKSGRSYALRSRVPLGSWGKRSSKAIDSMTRAHTQRR